MFVFKLEIINWLIHLKISKFNFGNQCECIQLILNTLILNNLNNIVISYRVIVYIRFNYKYILRKTTEKQIQCEKSEKTRLE